MSRKKLLTKRRKKAIYRKLAPLRAILTAAVSAIAFVYLLYQIFLLANLARFFK